MLTQDQRSLLINTFHSLTMLNFSSVLEHVSQSEFFVMAAVDKLSSYSDNDTGKVSGIAKLLRVSSPAVSRTLTSLEHKGYAIRFLDVQNRRNTYVKLTDEGSEVLHTEYENVNRIFGEVVENMGEEKIDQLVTLADELMNSFAYALAKTRSKA